MSASSALPSASSSSSESLTDPSSWAPLGESSADLWEERSNFVGIVLSSVAYGVHLTLFFFVLHHLIKHPTHRAGSGTRSRISWGLVAYITWNFILGTFGIAAESRFNQLTFIDARNFPGGPDAFVAAQYGDFINIFGTTAYVILNWFADGLVIYRFWLIYNFNYWITAIPCILLIGSFSMGVILLFQLTQPNANLWSTTTINFGIPYWSISASLNILVTSLIVARLYLIRRRTRAVLSTHHSRTYTSIAAMLVESAALYSVTALVFIVTYARNSDVQNLVLPVLGQVQAVSPLLIMWRVARGQAISRETMLTSEAMTPSKLSWRRSFTISAAGGRGSGSGSGNGTGTEIGVGMGTGGSTTSGMGVLDSTFSAAESYGAGMMIPGAAGTTCARSVYLPPLTKFRRDPVDEGDSEGDGEGGESGSGSGWELSERIKKGGRDYDDDDDEEREREEEEKKKKVVVKGVKVVVERQVERWDGKSRV